MMCHVRFFGVRGEESSIQADPCNLDLMEFGNRLSPFL